MGVAKPLPELAARAIWEGSTARKAACRPEHGRGWASDAEDQRALAEPNFAKAYAATGHVSVTAPSGAHVKVDGTEVGIAPLKDAVDVVVGTHAVDGVLGDGAAHASVETEGGKVTAVTLTIAGVTGVPPGAPVGPNPVPPGPAPREAYWNTRRTVGVAIAGVGVVGLVLGGVFGGERGSQTSDANAALASARSASPASLPATEVCTHPSSSGKAPCASLSSALQSNSSDAHLEEVFLISGVVLLVSGAVTTLWPSSSQAPSPALSPTAGPHMAGLQWSGTF